MAEVFVVATVCGLVTGITWQATSPRQMSSLISLVNLNFAQHLGTVSVMGVVLLRPACSLLSTCQAPPYLIFQRLTPPKRLLFCFLLLKAFEHIHTLQVGYPCPVGFNPADFVIFLMQTDCAVCDSLVVSWFAFV